MPSMQKLLAAAGLFVAGTSAVAVAQGGAAAGLSNAGPAAAHNALFARDDSNKEKQCPFDQDNLGPNLLLAVVVAPDGRKEIGGWMYGLGWCSNYNKITSGTNVCGAGPAEYVHIPLSDKFGNFNNNCYNNVKVDFENCENNDNGSIDYPEVKAHFKSTIKGDDSSVTYECKPTRELRACVYNPGRPDSDVSYTAFLACGIVAEP